MMDKGRERLRRVTSPQAFSRWEKMIPAHHLVHLQMRDPDQPFV